MLMKTLPLYLQDSAHPQAQVCARCEVRTNALFGALEPDALERIHAHIAAPGFQAEQRVYAHGAHGGAVYTVRSGLVRFERVSEGGQRHIVRLAARGDLIGQEALLGQAYRDDAVACTPVELCRIPVPLVEQLGAAETRLLRELMRRWQQALDEAAAWSVDLSQGTVRRRVLKLLLRLVALSGGETTVWLPQRVQMGDMLGSTFETCSRVLSQLRREGVVETLPTQQVRVAMDRAIAALAALDDAHTH